LPGVSEVRIEVPTDRTSLAETREALDRALARLLPGLLETRWEDETLHLSGPGAAGTVTLENGCLVGRARLDPPASLMRSMIEEKMTGLLRSVAVADRDA
jgi:hypothetical protein